jgi:membrane-bound serine protease (ClpP class)
MFDSDVHAHLLAMVADPNIAFILLIVGFYGLILEFIHPGVFLPGIIGGVSLILALAGLSALPVNYAGLGLIFLGIAFMLGEALTPGFGVLGLGGLAAFVFGSYFLFGGYSSDVAVSLPLIVVTALVTAGLTFGIVAAALQTRRKPAITGAEQIIGAQAEVVDWDGGTGHVRFNGEVWSARGKQPLQTGTTVRIVARDGLTLIIET